MSLLANNLQVGGTDVSPGNPVPVTVEGGSVTITAGGSIAVTNFPATQDVTGSVAVNNLPVVVLSAVVTATQQGTLVVKNSAGTLYDAYVVSQGTAGYLMIFNAGTSPNDGTVTPQHVIPVGTSSTARISLDGIGEAFGAGITLVFSSTGPFVKTASGSVFMRARAV